MAMEIVLVELPAEEVGQLLRALTPYLDHQAIDLDFRQLWDQNGLSAGILESNWPGVLRDALAPRTRIPPGMERFELTEDDLQKLAKEPPALLHKRMQFRNGESKELPLSDFYDEREWSTLIDGDRESLNGRAVRGWIQIRSQLAQGNSVEIQLTPKVTHGPMRQQVGVVESTLAYQTRQSERLYTQLPMKFHLSPGETVMVYGSGSSDDLGDLCLGSPHLAEGERRRFLLMRIVQTQHDDLFQVGEFQ